VESEVLTTAEDLIAHLICADHDDADHNVTGGKRSNRFVEVDASTKLKFDPMRPRMAYTFDPTDDDRLYASDASLLITSVPDILGDESEVVHFKEDFVMWTGYRRVRKTPRGVFVSGKVGAMYEAHTRCIYPNGESSYFRRLAAVTSKGAPLACINEGTVGRDSLRDSVSMILGAYVIEDAHRSGCFTTTVKETAGIVFPVPYGEQVEIFRLRDSPLSVAGKRKAILHWVSRHTRKRAGKVHTVKSHTRGVHEIEMAGFNIRLEVNDMER
jgi:hypothetical protein